MVVDYYPPQPWTAACKSFSLFWIDMRLISYETRLASGVPREPYYSVDARMDLKSQRSKLDGRFRPGLLFRFSHTPVVVDTFLLLPKFPHASWTVGPLLLEKAEVDTRQICDLTNTFSNSRPRIPVRDFFRRRLRRLQLNGGNCLQKHIFSNRGETIYW